MAASPHVDEIWIKLGKYGKYQIRQIIITIVAALPMAFHVVSVVFIGFKPDHVCKSKFNNTEGDIDMGIRQKNVTYNKCSITSYLINGSGDVEETTCLHGYTFETNIDQSFVTEWELVCDQDALAKMSQTLISAGMFLGAIASPLADRFGRKPIHCLFNIGLFTVTLLTAFIKNFTVFMVLRFLTGACQQGMVLTVYTIWIEMFPTENRTTVGIFSSFLWVLSFFMVLPFAYFLKDYGWRMIQLGMSLLSSIALIEYCLIDESLRWLLVTNREDAARALITKAANINCVDKDDVLSSMQINELKDISSQVNQIKATTNKIDETVNNQQNKNFEDNRATRDTALSRWKRNMHWVNLTSLKRNSLIIWSTWIVTSLAYYGLLFMMPTLEGNIYMNYLFVGITELIATIVLVFVLKYLNRRNGLIFFNVIGGICLVLASIGGTLTGNRISNTVLTLVGRGAIAASFGVLFLYTPELFPTNFRNAGIGIASGFGRFAGMLAPFSVYLAELAYWAPGVVFGILCFIISVLLHFVPETKGKELAQTVEELKEWEKTNKNHV